jgi:hypothetical protein
MKTLDSHDLELATGGRNNPAVAALKAQIKDRVNQHLSTVFADAGLSAAGAPGALAGAPGMATAAPGMAAAAPGAAGMPAMTAAGMPAMDPTATQS